MQTFLPYDDFVLSLDCLDYRRLGKQRVEAMQLLNAMKREKGGWINHPATKMWRGYEKALTEYSPGGIFFRVKSKLFSKLS